MGNLLQQGADWLGKMLRQSGGREVTYQQGDVLIYLTGTPAMHEYEIVGEDGFTTLVPYYDWTMQGATFRAAGITPRSGDRIEETLHGGIVTYEVLPAGNLPCVEWLDGAAVLYLIRTKRLG